MSAIPSHVSRDFAEMSIDNKLTFGDKVILALIAAGLLFPNLTVAIAGVISLTAANNDLRAKKLAYDGNPSLIGALETSERNWISLFEQDAAYVDSIAHGNTATLDASGYNRTKNIRDVTHIAAAPVFKSSGSTTTGGLDGEFIPEKDVKAYGALAYTSDLTPVFNGNQITFTFGPIANQSQISVIVGM